MNYSNEIGGKMEIELKLCGEDTPEKYIYSLQDWIKQEKIKSLKVARKVFHPKGGEMGLDPTAILSVVLGSAAIVELVKSLHIWIKTSRPKAKLYLKIENSEFRIDSENLPELQSLVRDVIKTMKNSERD